MVKVKKTTKAQKKTSKKNVDINDTESIMNDMKKLALKEPKEDPKEEETLKPTAEIETTVEQLSDIVEKETTTTVEQPSEKEIEKEEVPSEEPTAQSEDLKEKKDEDVSFVDELTESKKIIDNKEKPKRKTYQEMFGTTWCGYGFTNN